MLSYRIVLFGYTCTLNGKDVYSRVNSVPRYLMCVFMSGIFII